MGSEQDFFVKIKCILIEFCLGLFVTVVRQIHGVLLSSLASFIGGFLLASAFL
jgi:hypothetical protein